MRRCICRQIVEYDPLENSQPLCPSGWDGGCFSFGSTAGVGYEASNDVGNFWRIFIPQTEEEQRLADYTAPTYADDYRSLNDWSDRNEWELANVHDPTVMKAADGYYYMYQTDASYGNVHYASGGHYIGRRSKDLVHWEYVGTCMPKVPAWIRDSLNVYRKAMGLTASTVNWDDEAQFGWWAPCARKVNDNLYRMYYVVTLPGTITPNTAVGNPCFIGLMESTNPADSASWVDKGYVTTQYSDQGTDYEDKSAWGGYYRYNAIDPSYIITPEGEHWLIYGSWYSGFPAMQLDPSTGKSLKPHHLPWDAGNADAYGKRIFTRYRNNRWQASEAPEVVYHDGYYYLFVAFDELSKCYNTRVLRSETIDGQYVDITDRSLRTERRTAMCILSSPILISSAPIMDGWAFPIVQSLMTVRATGFMPPSSVSRRTIMVTRMLMRL